MAVEMKVRGNVKEARDLTLEKAVLNGSNNEKIFLLGARANKYGGGLWLDDPLLLSREILVDAKKIQCGKSAS